MRYEMHVTTSFGSCTTGGCDRRDLTNIGQFLTDVAEQEPNVRFTLQADNGPDFDGFYGDVQSVTFEVSL